MKVFVGLMAGVVIASLVGTASAVVVVGGTETFSGGTADWGVGGTDGWQVGTEGIGWEPGWSNNTHQEAFGSTGQIIRPSSQNNGQGISQGQLVAKDHAGANDTGSLVVQHLAVWSGKATAPDPIYTSNQIKYISFNSVAGVTYTLTGWVNTVLATGAITSYDSQHPKLVDHASPKTMADRYADIQIGLKNGLVTDNADVMGNQTSVGPINEPSPLTDNMAGGVPDATGAAWTQMPTVTAVGDGGPMTIILHVRMCDISTSGKAPNGNMWDDDVRFDDLALTPEPATLALLGLGLALVRRRR